MIGNKYSSIEQAQYKNNIGKKLGYIATGTDMVSIFKPSNKDSGITPAKEVTDSASFKTSSGLYFKSIAPNASDEVRNAWQAAASSTGVNSFAQDSSTYMSALFALQSEQRSSTGSSDVLGKTSKSATEAVKKAITKLEGQLNTETTNTKVKEYREKELDFYKQFLNYLDRIA